MFYTVLSLPDLCVKLGWDCLWRMASSSAWDVGVTGSKRCHGGSEVVLSTMVVGMYSGPVVFQTLFLMTRDEIVRSEQERRHGDGLRQSKSMKEGKHAK